MGIKRCPNCGSVKLLARKITGVQVESLENGEFKINAEGANYQLEIVGCAKCKSDFTEADLVEMAQCKKCGKYVEPQELDANGECEVCQALTENPDLANMTKEDVLRMYLKLQKSTSTTVEPVAPTPVQQTIVEEAPTVPVVEEPSVTSSVAEEKMKAAQAAISNVSNDFSMEVTKATEEQPVNTIEQTMNPPVEPDSTEEVAEDKPKRGRKPRKKVDVEETSGEVTEEQVTQSANEMADFQEAPFPEQDNEIKGMFAETVAQPEPQEQAPVAPEQNGTPFQIFDEEQAF